MARKLLIIIFLSFIGITSLLVSSFILKTRPELRQLIPSRIVGTLSKISFLSNVPNLKIKSYNEKALLETLAQLGFFQPLATTYYQSSGFAVKRITLSSLTVHLTDREQPLGQTVAILENGQEFVYHREQPLGQTVTILENGQEFVYQAFGFEYKPVENLNETYGLDLYLYVHKDLIEEETEEELAKRYQYQLLSATWNLTHPFLATHENYEQTLVGMDEFINRETKKKFFEIEKI